MHRRPFTLISSMVIVGFCIVAASAEPMAENPKYNSWARHKPGTVVTLETTIQMQGQNMTMQVMQKLTEVTPERAVVETTTNMQGQTMPAQKESINATVPRSQLDMTRLPHGIDGTVKEAGNDSITLAGKKYDCRIFEFTGKQHGSQVSGKVWYTEEIPGCVAKVDMTMTGQQQGNVKMEVASIDRK